MKFYWLFW